ncbi:MAG TPA: ABC transporter ATP-binding protein [Stellaceae bacterium]|jgi:branched-chain amino acid transport system ATP-binding protein|nr:ABC transporter ATP-binding protein [Stellaceae bacterium]
MTALLATSGLTAFYGDFQALFGVDIMIEEGETVAVIGANGAGKSTLLRTICGLLPAPADRIRYRGDNIGARSPADIVARGIALVPEGRKLFPSLSVEENLLMGRQCGRKGPWHLDRVYALFPILRERRRQPATSLSGGQQQMAAIGRALMTNPELLLCDEISLGLAPIVIRDVYAALPGIRAEGTTLVVVEQDIARALSIADRVYCLQEGRVTLEGRPGDLTRERIKLAYFGV